MLSEDEDLRDALKYRRFKKLDFLPVQVRLKEQVREQAERVQAMLGKHKNSGKEAGKCLPKGLQ